VYKLGFNSQPQPQACQNLNLRLSQPTTGSGRKTDKWPIEKWKNYPAKISLRLSLSIKKKVYIWCKHQATPPPLIWKRSVSESLEGSEIISMSRLGAV